VRDVPLLSRLAATEDSLWRLAADVMRNCRNLGASIPERVNAIERGLADLCATLI